MIDTQVFKGRDQSLIEGRGLQNGRQGQNSFSPTKKRLPPLSFATEIIIEIKQFNFGRMAS